MLIYGMSNNSIKEFEKKYNLIISNEEETRKDSDGLDYTGFNIIFKKLNRSIKIKPICGDCTAIQIYGLSSIDSKDLQHTIEIIQEFMSYNGRINGFFSIHCVTLSPQLKQITKDKYKILKSLPIVGLNIQLSNRNNLSPTRLQISGIIKCYKPIINNYDIYRNDCTKPYNYNDNTTALKLMEEFNS